MNIYSVDWLGNNQAKYTSYFLASSIGDVRIALRQHLSALSTTGKAEDLADMESVHVKRVCLPGIRRIYTGDCEVYVISDRYGDRIAVRLVGAIL